MVPGALSAAEAYGIPESAFVFPSLCRDGRRRGKGFGDRCVGADQPGEPGEQRGSDTGAGPGSDAEATGPSGAGGLVEAGIENCVMLVGSCADVEDEGVL